MSTEILVKAAPVVAEADAAGDCKPSLLEAAWLMAHRWKGRILLAVIDQGLASSANFLLTILCAIWLPLDGFGRYVIVWSISLLAETAQVSLILDSMPAIVARYGQRNRRRLDVAAFWVVAIYGAVTSVVMLISVPGFQHWGPEFTVPVLCLVVANPFQRLYVFLRRLCYIRDRQDVAALAALAYSCTLLGGAFWSGLLSVHAVVLLWGLANAVAVGVIYLMGVARPERVVPAHVAWLARQLWRSGRWLIGAAIGYWLTNWGMLPLVAATSGIATAGIIRALQNLFTPIMQFNAALNLAILPRVADKAVTVGPHYARSFAVYSTALFTLLVLLYAGIVMSTSHGILTLLYRKPEIAAGAYLLWPLGLALLLESARQGSTMALLSLNVTRIFFVSRMVAVSVFVVAAFILGRLWAADGILWANVLSHLAGTTLVIWTALMLSGKSSARRR